MGESPNPEQGIAALEQYGYGEKDPDTGLFEGYDLPKGILAPASKGFTWRELVERWGLVEYDFRHLLHVDLEAEFHHRSWRWFNVHIRGILSSPDSLLAADLKPDE